MNTAIGNAIKSNILALGYRYDRTSECNEQSLQSVVTLKDVS